MPFKWSLSCLCCLILYDAARTSMDDKRQGSSLSIEPGFPVPVKTNDPAVRRAARFGVYRYNNSSNDIFLFKESHINKAMVQIVRGLNYILDVDISRTICSKRTHLNLDRCDFQRNETLRQTFRCYFEVWVTPWQHRVDVPVSLCK